jgi:hypothetical protein
MEVSGKQYAMAALPPGRNSGTHEIVGWVAREVGLDRFREQASLLHLPVFKCRTVQPVAKLYGLSLTTYENKSQNKMHTLCKIEVFIM